MKTILTILLAASVAWGSDTTSYMRKVINTRHSDLIQYLPLDTFAGSVVYDWSGNSRNGTIAYCTLSTSGIKSGERSLIFNGSNAVVNPYSAALNSAFVPDSGTIMIWIYAPDWSYSGTKVGYTIQTTTGNLIQYGFTSTNAQLYMSRSGTAFNYQSPFAAFKTFRLWKDGTWLCYVLTWKNGDKGRFYVNGARLGQWFDMSSATFTGALSSGFMRIGSGNGAYYMNCKISHYAMWKCRLTDAEIDTLADIYNTKALITFGDSHTESPYSSVDSLSFTHIESKMFGCQVYQKQGYSSTCLQDSLGSTANQYVANAGYLRYDTTIIRHEPDIVVLHYGTNDIRNCDSVVYTLAKFDTQYTAVIDSLKKSGIPARNIILSTITYVNNYGYTTSILRGCNSLTKHLIYNDAIRTMARSAGVKLSDPYNYFVAHDTVNTMYSDGIHLTDLGNSYVAKADSIAYYRKSTGNNKPSIAVNLGL